MPGTNNFLQWNPTAANQESDAAYTADSMRQNGAGSGQIFPSATANKLFYQVAQMTVALATAMANKNFNMQDGNLTNLVTALSNILTTNDFSKGNNSNGYWEKAQSGLIRQWGAAGVGSNPVSVTFPTPFTTLASIAVVVSPRNYGTGATRNTVYRTATTITTFTAQTDSSSCAFDWIAFGY